MRVVCGTPPSIEPVSLAELKLHLRADAGSFAEAISETPSLFPASRVVADDYTTHVGAAVEVLGLTAVVLLQAGTNGAGGTVDVKIQDSDDTVTWTDWAGGAFTQVTEATDQATTELAYTGPKRYVRTVAKVLVASCTFGTAVVTWAGSTAEDALLTAILQAAREQVETITRRKLLTQTWAYSLPAWPAEEAIILPFGNLASVTSVKWKDTAGVETTLVANTDYLVETNGEGCGRIVLPYGTSWPGGTLYPSNPITVQFVCGWTAAASIPAAIRTAVKMLCADCYEHRGEAVLGQTVVENRAVERLLAAHRLWEEF